MELRPLAGKVKRKLKPPKYHPPKKSGDKYKILGKWMYIDDKDSLKLAKFGIYNYEETKLIKKSCHVSIVYPEIKKLKIKK
jgi:hypothetical protein